MKKLQFVILLVLLSGSYAFADAVKLYIQYENTSTSGANKMNVKLYKEGERYKLVRALSDSPGETGNVTTYIDVAENSVITVTEKNGVKKGTKSAWSDDYSGLVIQYKVLFRGIPKGKSEKTFTKRTGTESVNGKECDVYESGLSFLGASTKYYMWNDVMLKSEAPDNLMSAVTIDEDPVFMSDEFVPPADVDWNM
jgi:hypothetical protein